MLRLLTSEDARRFAKCSMPVNIVGNLLFCRVNQIEDRGSYFVQTRLLYVLYTKGVFGARGAPSLSVYHRLNRATVLISRISTAKVKLCREISLSLSLSLQSRAA